MFILTRFPDGVLTMKTWWQDLEAIVHMASASGDRSRWVLVLGLLSFLCIVSSQEMILPVGSWSLTYPPVPIKIVSTDIPRDHPLSDSSWHIYLTTEIHSQLSVSTGSTNCIEIRGKKYRIMLSMYTAFMVSIVRNLEMLYICGRSWCIQTVIGFV